ncbi:MAG: 3-hydroxyacyl-ACP dehydratase FabZ family protein [Desulfobacterales bacterium]
MQNNWYCLKNLETDCEGVICARAVVPADSPWFSGHFPEDPILPAIAQLAIVSDMIQEATGREQNPGAVNRVKYRRIIRPDETILVAATPVDGKPGIFSFQMSVDDQMACKGRITMDPAK